MNHLLAEYAPSLLGPSAFIGSVVSVKDPQNLNRVQIRVATLNGVADQDSPVWARVTVPFAGNNRGAFFMPDVGDEVLVTYLAGDPRFPVVLGSMWNGHDTAPETLGGSRDSVDRWTITGKAGTKIAIVEAASGSPTITFSTPGGLTGTMTDAAGGSIEFVNSQSTSVRIDTSGVAVKVPTGSVQVTSGSGVTVNSPTITVNSAMSTFNGIIKCDLVIATAVQGTTYTPGAGNLL
jgi:uncharacterized protein involved in type VI secretion and phage assembly